MRLRRNGVKLHTSRLDDCAPNPDCGLLSSHGWAALNGPSIGSGTATPRTIPRGTAVIESKQHRQRSVSSPEAWYGRFPSAVTSLELSSGTSSLIKHFRAVPGAFAQPPLDAHVVALHLGGAKRVRRAQGKRQTVHDVALGSMTLMPAYQANSWQTEGPIEFAHLTISVGAVEQIILEEFDREPATHRLHDTVGLENALLEQVFQALLTKHKCSRRSHLHTESLLTVFATTLLERHSTLSGPGSANVTGGHQRGGLAGWQLRRIVEFMDAHLGADILLGDLAALTGLSRAHFFRTFRQSTGRSPGQFLVDLRMRRACTLLETTALAIGDIAGSLGFCHTRHFSTAFAKRFGVSPRLFRVSRQ